MDTWRLGGKDGGPGEGLAATRKIDGFWHVKQGFLPDGQRYCFIPEVWSYQTHAAIQNYRQQAVASYLRQLAGGE